jgi:hypothetical protein
MAIGHNELAAAVLAQRGPNILRSYPQSDSSCEGHARITVAKSGTSIALLDVENISSQNLARSVSQTESSVATAPIGHNLAGSSGAFDFYLPVEIYRGGDIYQRPIEPPEVSIAATSRAHGFASAWKSDDFLFPKLIFVADTKRSISSKFNYGSTWLKNWNLLTPYEHAFELDIIEKFSDKIRNEFSFGELSEEQQDNLQSHIAELLASNTLDVQEKLIEAITTTRKSDLIWSLVKAIGSGPSEIRNIHRKLITDLLEHDSAGVRMAAAGVIGDYQDSAALATIASRLQRETNKFVRSALIATEAKNG